MTRAPIFDAAKRLGAKFRTKADVATMDRAIDQAEGKTLAPAAKPSNGLAKVRGPLFAIVGSVAATSLFASVPADEGTKYKAYRDIVGVWTICQGDTKNVRSGMIETPAGCHKRLETQLVAHARPVMQCSFRLAEPGRDYQRAAAVSLAYNIGVGAYCRSTVDRRFDAGDFRGGCDAILRFDRAGGRQVRGLQLRRQRERAICLKGLS